MTTFSTGGKRTPIDFTKCKHPGEYNYTSKASGYEFTFNVNNDAGEYRAYIVNSPGYGSRDKGPHPTHRLPDKSKNQMYVCTDPNNKPSSIEETLTWAVMWAEGTDAYIKTGNFKQVRP